MWTHQIFLLASVTAGVSSMNPSMDVVKSLDQLREVIPACLVRGGRVPEFSSSQLNNLELTAQRVAEGTPEFQKNLKSFEIDLKFYPDSAVSGACKNELNLALRPVLYSPGGLRVLSVLQEVLSAEAGGNGRAAAVDRIELIVTNRPAAENIEKNQEAQAVMDGERRVLRYYFNLVDYGLELDRSSVRRQLFSGASLGAQ